VVERGCIHPARRAVTGAPHQLSVQLTAPFFPQLEVPLTRLRWGWRVGAEAGTTRTAAVPLYDQWCYYYRLSVVMLFEQLPRGCYTARVWVDALQPSREFTRQPAPPGVQVRQGTGGNAPCL
jgi:hypothetical protein